MATQPMPYDSRTAQKSSLDWALSSSPPSVCWFGSGGITHDRIVLDAGRQAAKRSDAVNCLKVSLLHVGLEAAAVPGHVVTPGVVDDGGVAAVDLAVDEALDDAVVASSCRLPVA